MLKSIKNINWHRLILLFLTGFSLLVTSCVKDKYDLDKITGSYWNSQWCAHLVHSELTVNDILKNDSVSFIKTDANNFITLAYGNTVFSKTALELINIPDQAYNADYKFIVPGVFPAGNNTQTIYHTEFDFNLNNGEIIDSIIIDTLQLNVQITTNINSNTKITISTGNITLNGNSFNVTLNHNYQGSASEVIDSSFTLTGYKIAFDNSGSTKNKFPFDIKAIAISLGNTVNNPYDLKVLFSVSKIKFRSIFGYFGQLNFSVDQDTVKINLFDNNLKGNIKFLDPKLNFHITNSFGAPINLNFNNLIAHSDVNPPYNVTLSGSGIPNPWQILYPVKIGDIDSTILNLDKTNSNILNIFNISPVSFIYKLNALMNPSGNTAQNFALSTSCFKVDGEVDMPLYATAEGYVLQDTVSMDISDVATNYDKFDFVNFLVRTTNGFPLEAKLQVYFVDSNKSYPPVDSLFDSTEVIMAAATPGAAPNLRPVQPAVNFKEISIKGIRAKNWNKVKYFVIKAKLSTYNNGTIPVKIYSDFKLDVDIGLQTKLKINLGH